MTNTTSLIPCNKLVWTFVFMGPQAVPENGIISNIWLSLLHRLSLSAEVSAFAFCKWEKSLGDILLIPVEDLKLFLFFWSQLCLLEVACHLPSIKTNFISESSFWNVTTLLHLVSCEKRRALGLTRIFWKAKLCFYETRARKKFRKESGKGLALRIWVSNIDV